MSPDRTVAYDCDCPGDLQGWSPPIGGLHPTRQGVVMVCRPPRPEAFVDPLQEEVSVMSVTRATEITAGSPTGFEYAINIGVARLAQAGNDVRSARVKNLEVLVEDGRVTEYRVRLKATTVLD